MQEHAADVRLPADRLTRFGRAVLAAIGCGEAIAAEVADHLVEADLRGTASHGIFRLLSYVADARSGDYIPAAEPVLAAAEAGAPCVDGGNGFGIPALRLAADTAAQAARAGGSAAVGVRNVGHTGRIGAFAARAADAGCLAVILGGGARRAWPQVAPHGGRRAALPTNPYALAIPGGAHGPVVIDFATSAAAAGKVSAARAAGRPIPEGLCIDRAGQPTTDPNAYFDGGALLPMAGPKGFGLGLIAELLGEAIDAEARSGMNWICVCVDLGRFRAADAYRRAAESCLAEIRGSPPAPGHAAVRIPGEHGAALLLERSRDGIPIPAATLASLRDLGRDLGVDTAGLHPG